MPYKTLFSLLLFLIPLLAYSQEEWPEYSTLDSLYRVQDSIITEARMAIGQDSSRVEEYHKILQILKERKEYDRELIVAQKMTYANPASSQAYFAYGDAFLNNGRPHEAIDEFKKALRVDHKHVRARTTMAEAYTMLDMNDSALLHLDTAVAMNPRDAQSHMQRARLLSKQGRFNEAVENYRRWSELLPGSATAWLELGKVLFKVAEYEEASEILSYVMELSPNSADALYFYAETQSRMGHFDKAGEAYQQFFLKFPTDPRAMDAERAARDMNHPPEGP